jgi:hypothetical protein
MKIIMFVMVMMNAPLALSGEDDYFSAYETLKEAGIGTQAPEQEKDNDHTSADKKTFICTTQKDYAGNPVQVCEEQ